MTLRPRPEILGIDPYTPGVSKLPGAQRVIKLSSNEGRVRAAAGGAAGDRGGDPFAPLSGWGCHGATHAIAERFGLDAEKIVCGAGSTT